MKNLTIFTSSPCDANAQAFYMPKKKLKANVNFFEANNSLVKRKEEWDLYTNNPIAVYSINGTRFSIFNTGRVEEFSVLFTNILNKALN